MILTGWLQQWADSSRSSRKTRQRRLKSREPVAGCVEFLEHRQLLTAAVLAKDIKPGADGSFPQTVVTFGGGGGVLYFGGNDGSNTAGRELWKSDGTAAGTVMVKDINPGAEGSDRPSTSNQTKSGLGEFLTMGATTYFTANDGTNGSELWKTDGTAAGTVMVKDINTGAAHSEPSKFVKLNATQFLFYAKTAASGYELWISDGTDAGTTMVKEIGTGAANGVDPDESPLPVVIGTTAYFTANEGITGYELWTTDGTAANTNLVKDINPGTASISPPQFAPEFVAVGTKLFFSAMTAANGTELWVSDGTAGGTTLVKDIYTGQDPQTPANPASSSPSGLVAFGSQVVFMATTAAEGTELWISDGTDAGTKIVKDIYTGSTTGAPNSSRPKAMGVVGGVMLFTANNGVNGEELWKTDGTAANTAMVKDLNPGGADGANAQDGFVIFDNKLFFVGETPATFKELFSSDGTAANTLLDTDVKPGPASTPGSNISALTSTGTRLFFIADNGTTGSELWTRDVGASNPPPPNNAPVLDNTGDTYYIAGVGQRLTTALTSGILVSDMLATGKGAKPITDADAFALQGIAITNIDRTYGKWQYTNAFAPKDSDWVDVDAAGAVSNSSALLLRPDSRVRLLSALKPHHDGTVGQGFLPIESKMTAGITFRAWDQTSGLEGQRADTSTNGGTTAFSTATEDLNTFFEARLWRSFNKNAGLNVYTLEAEFFALTANTAYEDRSTDSYTGFTVYLSPLTAAVPTAGMIRMYYGVQFNADDGTETDMGYRYLTTNPAEATALEGMGPVGKQAQRSGAYFREIGVNKGTAITGYIATTAQPGTTEMFQEYRLDSVNKPTRPGGTAEGSAPTSQRSQEIGDHVYSPNFSWEMTNAGSWRKEASRGFVRELSTISLVVTSSDFEPGKAIPAVDSKAGGNKSPALAWSTGPLITQAYAVIVEDADATGGAFSHWVVWNIPGNVLKLDQGVAKTATLGDGTKQGQNGFAATGYDGPQPPAGQTHRYFFQVYALNSTLTLADTATAADLKAALAGKIIASGRTMGTFAG